MTITVRDGLKYLRTMDVPYIASPIKLLN